MFLPDNIDLGKSENYILTIRITPNGLAFSIHEPRMGGNYCYRETSFSKESDRLSNIQRIIFDYNFLTHVFKQTNVVFVSKEYDIAPQYLFEKNKKEALYNFTHQEQVEQVLISPDPIQQNITFFNADKEIYKFLMRSLYNPHFFHHSNLLMKYIEGKNRMTEKRSKIYLNFHNEFLDVFCYDEKSNLLHPITFQQENEHNLIYFILNIWDKCNFDQSEDYLYILENFAGSDKHVLPLLRDYIKHIETVGVPSEVEFMGTDSKQAPLDLLILATI